MFSYVFSGNNGKTVVSHVEKVVLTYVAFAVQKSGQFLFILEFFSEQSVNTWRNMNLVG